MYNNKLQDITNRQQLTSNKTIRKENKSDDGDFEEREVSQVKNTRELKSCKRLREDKIITAVKKRSDGDFEEREVSQVKNIQELKLSGKRLRGDRTRSEVNERDNGDFEEREIEQAKIANEMGLVRKRRREEKEERIFSREVVSSVLINQDIVQNHLVPKLLVNISIYCENEEPKYESDSELKFSHLKDLMNFALSCKVNYASVMDYIAPFIKTLTDIYIANKDDLKERFMTMAVREDGLIFILWILKGLGKNYADEYFQCVDATYQAKLNVCMGAFGSQSFSDQELKNLNRIVKVMKKEPQEVCRIEFLLKKIINPNCSHPKQIEVKVQSRAIEHLCMLTNNGFFKGKQPMCGQILNYALKVDLALVGPFIKLFIAFAKAGLLETGFSNRLSGIVLNILNTYKTRDLRPLALRMVNIFAGLGLFKKQDVNTRKLIVHINQKLENPVFKWGDLLAMDYEETRKCLYKVPCLLDNTTNLCDSLFADMMEGSEYQRFYDI